MQRRTQIFNQGPWFFLALLSVTLGGCAMAPSGPAPVTSIGHQTTPQSARPAPARRSEEPRRYRVQEGDTLYSIAWGLGADYRDLAAWNGIRPPYTIYQDQQLRLAPPRPAASGANRVAATSVRVTPMQPPPRPQAESSRWVSETAPPTQTPSVAPAPPVSIAESTPDPVARPSVRPAPAPQQTPPPEPAAAESAPPRSFPKGPLHWAWPADGEVVERFDQANLIKGIRIAGQPGEPVRAAEAGEVVYSNAGISRLGPVVIIKHNAEYLSAYSMNRALLVKEGQWVEKGAKIAEMGVDPKEGSGLLHFEIRLAGDPVDPLNLLGPNIH